MKVDQASYCAALKFQWQTKKPRTLDRDQESVAEAR